MPSRTPRRSFASPFVVIAGASACYVAPAHGPPPPAPPPSTGTVATAPPPSTTPPPTDGGNPNVGDSGNPVVITNPPPPQPALPTYAARWRLYSIKGDCFAAVDVKCPTGEPGKPVPTCNPPPPMKYACPENITLPIWIERTEGSTVCRTDPEKPKCPANTVCNPPPPRPVACPER
jgi:hypothetical protein